jgi:drug/metabolite transporter (DMT)-like permease
MDIIVIGLALCAALFYGVALVLGQAGLRHLGPLQGVCIAISSATLVFVLLAPVTIGFDQWNWRAAGMFALIGCLFPASVTILTFYSNRLIGPNFTGALGNLAPLFAVGGAVALLGETADTGKIAGVIIIFAGVVLLYRAPRSAAVTAIGWAFALPIGAAFVRGGVQPLVKIGLEDWPNPFAAITIGYLVSTLVVLGGSAVRERGWPVNFSRKGWFWFVLVGLSNGLAVFCTYQALALGSVTIVAPLIACYPLATLAVGRVFNGAAGITRHAVMGVLITVAGVAVLLIV